MADADVRALVEALRQLVEPGGEGGAACSVCRDALPVLVDALGQLTETATKLTEATEQIHGLSTDAAARASRAEQLAGVVGTYVAERDESADLIRSMREALLE